MAHKFPRLSFELSQTPVANQGCSTLVLLTLKDSESQCEAKSYMLHQNTTESANPGDIKIKIGERILIWSGSNKSWSSERIEDLEVIYPELIKDKYVKKTGYNILPDTKAQDVDKIHFNTLSDSSVFMINAIHEPEDYWKDCIEENSDSVFEELNRAYKERARLIKSLLFMDDLREEFYNNLLSKETKVGSYKDEFIDFIVKFFFTKDEINKNEIYEDYDPIDEPDNFTVDFILSIIKKLGGKSKIEKHLLKLFSEMNNLANKIKEIELEYRNLVQNVKIPALTKSEYLKACGVIEVEQENSIDDWQFQSEDAILVNPGVQDTCTSWVPNKNVNIIVDTYGNVYKYRPIAENIQCLANGETVGFESPYIGSKGFFRKISEKILEDGSVKALRLGYNDYTKMLGCKHVAKTEVDKKGRTIFTIDSVEH